MKRKGAGLTLIETLIACSVFVVFSVAIYELYAKVVEVSTNIRVRTVATQLANEQFEFIRNLQYSDVGVVNGIPSGIVDASQTLIRNNMSFTVETTIRNIDQTADGTLGGTPNDLSPADNKLVEVTVLCASCKNQNPITYTSWVAPKSLETENGNGALVIKAIDANGLPLSGATVHIENPILTPPVDITDITDAAGALTVVDAPPSAEQYRVTVSKVGYSTEQTYQSGDIANPNPLKPYLTVSANSVTQSTFAIDANSTFTITSETNTCAPIGNVSGTFTGTKLIGTNPDILKHTYSFSTNSGGSTSLSAVEWDTYIAAISSASYDLIGINPLQPITVPPGSAQNISLILEAANPNRLLVAVIDSTTGLPLSGATVELSNGGTPLSVKSTNIGSLTQTDWSGGGGQETFTDTTKYESASGVDGSTSVGQLQLADTGGGVYIASGALTSSVFDLGSSATFQQLSWLPTAQPVGTSVQFQIATSNTNDVATVWTFLGPDGTDATYYDTSLTDIAGIHDGDRYVRYKVFLSTTDTGISPILNDISFTYTSSCMPPGQTDFGGLSNQTYTVTVSKAGYATEAKDVTINNSDANISFSLVPS